MKYVTMKVVTCKYSVYMTNTRVWVQYHALVQEAYKYAYAFGVSMWQHTSMKILREQPSIFLYYEKNIILQS